MAGCVRQSGVVPQDRRLKIRQCLTRREAQLLIEACPQGPERLQGVGLPTRPVQGEHQLAPQVLPERVGVDERLELTDELPVATQGQVGVDAGLPRNQPELVEPGGLRFREPRSGEVLEDRSAPEPQGLPQLPCSVLRSRAVEGGSPPCNETFEAGGVHLLWTHPQGGYKVGGRGC